MKKIKVNIKPVSRDVDVARLMGGASPESMDVSEQGMVSDMFENIARSIGCDREDNFLPVKSLCNFLNGIISDFGGSPVLPPDSGSDEPECESHDDCSEPEPRCSTENICVECLTTGDCEEPNECGSDTNECYLPDGKCEDDADCDDMEICSEFICEEVECKDDGHCDDPEPICITENELYECNECRDYDDCDMDAGEECDNNYVCVDCGGGIGDKCDDDDDCCPYLKCDDWDNECH